MQGISQNGFIMSQSANNSASNSRRTSQKSGKSAMGYQTQGAQHSGPNGGNQLGGNPQFIQSSHNASAYKQINNKNQANLNIYQTHQQQPYN